MQTIKIDLSGRNLCPYAACPQDTAEARTEIRAQVSDIRELPLRDVDSATRIWRAMVQPRLSRPAVPVTLVLPPGRVPTPAQFLAIYLFDLMSAALPPQ